MVRRLVHSLGYRYRLHVQALPGTPDLVFPRLRKIINVSGCFWHMHACGRCRVPSSRRDYWIAKLTRNKERDHRNRRALRRLGWDVLTIWECQTRNADRLSKTIKRYLGSTGSAANGIRDSSDAPVFGVGKNGAGESVSGSESGGSALEGSA